MQLQMEYSAVAQKRNDNQVSAEWIESVHSMTAPMTGLTVTHSLSLSVCWMVIQFRFNMDRRGQWGLKQLEVERLRTSKRVR